MWILTAVTLAASTALIVRPGKESRLAMSILAGLWCLTLVLAVFGIAVILALWLPEASKRYFAACEQRMAAKS